MSSNVRKNVIYSCVFQLAACTSFPYSIVPTEHYLQRLGGGGGEKALSYVLNSGFVAKDVKKMNLYQALKSITEFGFEKFCIFIHY